MRKYDALGIPIYTAEEAEEQSKQWAKEKGLRSLPPEFAREGSSYLPTADQGSQTNREVAQSFMGRREIGITILESDTATGKSHAMADAISQTVKRNPNTRVLVVVENHKIAEETRIKFKDREVEAAIYRGAEAKDPNFEGHPQDSEPDPNLTLDLMCKRAPARQATGKIDRANSACKGCPFHPKDALPGKACGYQQQALGELRDQIAEAQVVIVSSDNFLTRSKHPSALKRKPSWKWKTFDRELDDWIAKETAEERGTTGLCKLDFTHIWVDELNPQSIAIGAPNQISTEALGGVERLIKQGMDLGVDVFELNFALLECWEQFGLPGDPDGIDVVAWLSDRCDALRGALAKISADGSEKIPARVTLRDLETAGLSIPVLKTIRRLIYCLKVKPDQDESGALGTRSVEEIEAEFAAFFIHNATVDKIRKFVSAILTSAERLDERHALTDLEVSNEAARRVDAGESGGIFLPDLREEMEREREQTGGSGRDLPLPGVTAYQRLMYSDPDSIEGIEVSTVKAVQRGSLGNLIKTIPTMITAAAQDHSLVSAALGVEDLEFAGSGRVRDGEGVMRVQSRDKLFSKAMIVPVFPAKDAESKPDYNTEKQKNARARNAARAKNAARVAHDALVTAAMSGQVFSLSGADSGSEAVSATSGLITHKKTRDYIKKAYPGFEDQVIVGHFGATTGSNEWEGVRSLTIAGRQAQDVRGVEAAAEVIFEKVGDRIEADADGQVMFEKPLEYVPDRYEHGVKLTIEGEKHPEEGAEIIRGALTSESLLQAEARGRGARRTADTPLTVNVATSATLDRQIDDRYTFQEFRARTGIISMPVALGVFPATTGPGKNNLNGYLFHLIGRAGCAALRNQNGALPICTTNPALLRQEGEEATPSACSKALHDEFKSDPMVRDLVEQIEAVIEHGEAGKSYRVAGLPMVSALWHRVTVTIKGSDLEVHARGDSEAEAQRRAESVLLAGLSAVEGAEDGMVEIGDVQIPVNTTPRESRAVENLLACLNERDVIPLTGGSAHALFPEKWKSRRTANRDLSEIQNMFDGGEVSSPEMADAPVWSIYRAIFEGDHQSSDFFYRSPHRENPNNSDTPKIKVQKWPGVISPKYDGSEQVIADANMLSSVLEADGGAVVRFTRSHKSAKPMEVFVSMPQVSHVIKKVLKGHDPLALEKAHAEEVEKAMSLKAEKALAVKVAKAELEEGREAAKLAKEQFDAGLVSKAVWRAAREAQGPLREALADAKEQSKLARVHVARIESKKPEAKKSMNTLTDSALGAIVRLLGTENVECEVVALIPPGLEIDMNPALQEAEPDQQETQPEGDHEEPKPTDHEPVELTEDEQIELELELEHAAYVEERQEAMMLAEIVASVACGNLPFLEAAPP